MIIFIFNLIVLGEEKFGYVWYDFNYEVKMTKYDNL